MVTTESLRVYGGGSNRAGYPPANQRSNMRTTDVRWLCQLIVGMCTASSLPWVEHVKSQVTVIDRVHADYAQPNIGQHDNHTPPHRDNCGDEETERVGVISSNASGKTCINNLKKCQQSRSKEGNIYALDRACCGARPKSLPDILPESLSSQCHPVHAERTQRGRRIK